MNRRGGNAGLPSGAHAGGKVGATDSPFIEWGEWDEKKGVPEVIPDALESFTE